MKLQFQYIAVLMTMAWGVDKTSDNNNANYQKFQCGAEVVEYSMVHRAGNTCSAHVNV